MEKILWFAIWKAKPEEYRGKTEDGQVYYIENAEVKERCRVRSGEKQKN